MGFYLNKFVSNLFTVSTRESVVMRTKKKRINKTQKCEKEIATATEKIGDITLKLPEISTNIAAFCGERTEKTFLKIENDLTRMLCGLDAIVTDFQPAMEEVKGRRKEAVLKVQHFLNLLESRVGATTPMALADTEDVEEAAVPSTEVGAGDTPPSSFELKEENVKNYVEDVKITRESEKSALPIVDTNKTSKENVVIENSENEKVDLSEDVVEKHSSIEDKNTSVELSTDNEEAVKIKNIADVEGVGCDSTLETVKKATEDLCDVESSHESVEDDDLVENGDTDDQEIDENDDNEDLIGGKMQQVKPAAFSPWSIFTYCTILFVCFLSFFLFH